MKHFIISFLVTILAFILPAAAVDFAVSCNYAALDQNSTNLFKVENLDYETNSPSMSVNLSYTLEQNQTILFRGKRSLHVKKYTSAQTGEVPDNFSSFETTVLVCANVTGEVNDTNLTNNHGCWTLPFNNSQLPISITNESSEVKDNQTENESFSEDLLEEELCEGFDIVGVPLVVQSGERLSYSFEDWKDGDEVRYWIEDLAGGVMKNAVTTTSSAPKSYTPKSEVERALIIKATRYRDGCAPIDTNRLFAIEGIIEEGESFDRRLFIDDAPGEGVGGEQIVIKISGEHPDEKVTIAADITYQNERLSRTKLVLLHKGRYEASIPIALPQVCNLPTGIYTLSVTDGKLVVQQALFIAAQDCPREESISSLYVRAKNYQENISLYGRAEKESTIGIYELLATYSVPKGSFNVLIPAHLGKTSIAALIGNETVQGRMVSFSLSGSIDESHNENVSTQTMLAPPPGHTTIVQEATIQGPLEPEKSYRVEIITAISIAALVVFWFKRKHLRITRGSKWYHEQAGD